MININGAIVYADEIDDIVYNQIEQITKHPVFKNSKIRIMPDCHAGKGCVIGFTSVNSNREIIPNVVGVDIGCGVRSVIFNTKDNINFKALDNFIKENIPSGMNFYTSPHKNIYSSLADKINYVSELIGETEKKDCFFNSLGTLGGGNHFIEIGKISENRYMLSIHTGSRNFGLKICRYFQKMGNTVDIKEKNRLISMHKTALTSEEHTIINTAVNNLAVIPSELAYITDENFEKYMKCMDIAKEYASCNRIFIANDIMNYLSENYCVTIEEEFDTIHNYIDWYNSEHTETIIRKGAVSAEKNQRLSIPLNMKDGIVVGTGKGNAEWNFSAPHGAGRRLSRSEAKKNISLEEFENTMKGIETWSVSENTIDESPQVYKNSENIISYIKQSVNIDFIAKTIYNFKCVNDFFDIL